MSERPDEEVVQSDGGDTATSTERVTEEAGETFLELASSPTAKAYTTYFGAVYGALGIGIGVLLFVLDAVGMSPLVVNYPQYSQSAGKTVMQHESVPLISGEYMYPLLMILAFALGVWASVAVARNADLDDREVFVSAAVSVGIGTLVLMVVGGFLASQQLRLLDFFQSFAGFGTGSGSGLSQFYSVKILNLVVNAAIIGVVVGLVSGAATRFHRTYRPE